MKKTYKCDWCGKEFERDECFVRGKQHIFCCRPCLWAFSSKTKNPERYSELKDLSGVSAHMSELNRELNPSRMSFSTRTKLRNAHLGTGKDVSRLYPKYYSRLEHHVVAEQILGRPLRDGEVVHHIDGNPRNNSPENIFVFASQSEHSAHHAFLRHVLGGGDGK